MYTIKHLYQLDKNSRAERDEMKNRMDKFEERIIALEKALNDIKVPNGGTMDMRNAARTILRQAYTIAEHTLTNEGK